jgi:hypothetical protein
MFGRLGCSVGMVNNNQCSRSRGWLAVPAGFRLLCQHIDRLFADVLT